LKNFSQGAAAQVREVEIASCVQSGKPWTWAGGMAEATGVYGDKNNRKKKPRKQGFLESDGRKTD
jgi:hypothetical protein